MSVARTRTYDDDEMRLLLLTRRYVDPSFGCWIWTGPLNSYGYGLTAVGYDPATQRNRAEQTHRVSYRLWVGPIPSGLQIDHLCNNRPCGNPRHLEAVTLQENIARRIGRGHFKGLKRDRAACRAGHDLTVHGRPRPDAPLSIRCALCQKLAKERAA